jgi:hypothetical protein
MERTRARRRAVLDECIEEDALMTERLWHCLREGALFKKQYGKQWEMYEDPDTGNYFYTKAPHNVLMGDTHSDYSWCEPAVAKALIDRTNAMKYLIKVRSTFLRQFEEWHCYRCNRTGVEFYYNVTTNDLSFNTPKHLQWRPIQREAVNTKERLGYGTYRPRLTCSIDGLVIVSVLRTLHLTGPLVVVHCCGYRPVCGCCAQATSGRCWRTSTGTPSTDTPSRASASTTSPSTPCASSPQRCCAPPTRYAHCAVSFLVCAAPGCV